jgi:hypothetical protein
MLTKSDSDLLSWPCWQKVIQICSPWLKVAKSDSDLLSLDKIVAKSDSDLPLSLAKMLAKSYSDLLSLAKSGKK